jgi:acid stress-induced BolA-like protein IbaG/YrbA
MIEEDIREKILEDMPNSEVTVMVEGNRASITVVSPLLRDLNRVQRHQRIYHYIDHYISDGTLHAVNIVARSD